MIVKTIAALGVASAIAIVQLAGCTQGVNIAQVQAAAQAACAFVPTAATIASIIAADKTSVQDPVAEATKIASLICATVAKVGTNPGAAADGSDRVVAQVNVRGQTIKVAGHFVRR